MTTPRPTASIRQPHGGTLGPFELLEPLGRGAMGEVWRCRHRDDGIEVAVKIITAGGTASSLFLGGFKREVQAMAGLAHPNIVTVFDHGRVDRAAADAPTRLPDGAPWVALERASASLADVLLSDWPALRFVLRHILAGLAHAHAHGIVHRDLKPANVLLVEEPDVPGGLRPVLADFGIAHALDAEARGLVRPAFIGTPWYAPPEQIATAWRDQGPWTDLYALGCMAWMLCTGAPPFRGPDVESTFALHLAAPLPALEPRFDVPPAFLGWLTRSLAKLPAQRFRHAADAAWCLDQLDDLGERLDDCSLRLTDGSVLRVRAESSRAALPAAPDARTVIARAPAARPPSDAPLPWSPATHLRARDLSDDQLRLPFRESWRAAAAMSRPARVRNVGLGLFDLRAVPFIDRDAERDQLWDALRIVHTHRRPAAVVVRGATGAGSSRLAEWIGRRAAEHGLATLLRASHSPTGGPASGLPPTLARHFACTGLQRRQLFGRLEALFERLRVGANEDASTPSDRVATRIGEPAVVTRWEAAALTELLQPRGGDAPELDADHDDVPRVRISSASEWQFILARVLRRVCVRRPAIVWLDDVHWGLDSLSLVRAVLDDERYANLPVLFLLTVRDDELVSRPREAEQLAALLEAPNTRSVALRPLSEEHHGELVAQLLPLAPGLREHVELRTAGNPLFAIQLVGEWVERAALVPGAEGYELRTEAVATLPNSIHELWRARIERVIERATPAQRPLVQRALELAAALGGVVSLPEWLQVCALAGQQVPHGLLDALVGSSLALREHHSWRFVHVMLQESLLRSAADARRLHEHHAHCAAALLRLYGPESGLVAERRSHHLIAAGLAREALAPLADAIRLRLRTDDFPAAEQLLELREQLTAAAADTTPVSSLLAGFILRAELERRRGGLDEAVAWTTRALELHPSDDDLDAVLVRNALGGAALAAGDPAGAERAFAGAAEIAERLRAAPSPETSPDAAAARLAQLTEALAEALQGQARVLVREGELARTERLAERARAYFLSLGDRFQAGWCSMLHASVAKLRDDVDGAERHIREAWAAFETLGSRAGLAACTNMLAEVARARDDLDEAEWLYRRAAADWRAIGAWDYATALLNVALVKLRQGALDEARGLIERIEAPAVQRGDRFVAALCQLCRLATLSANERHSLPTLLGAVDEFLAETGYIERDIAFLLEFASQRLDQLGHPETALATRRLALLQWRGLDDQAEVERLEGRLRVGLAAVPGTRAAPPCVKPGDAS